MLCANRIKFINFTILIFFFENSVLPFIKINERQSIPYTPSKRMGFGSKWPNLSYWGGMPFWPVSSFLPTFLTIFLYFFFGKRVKTLLWVTPEAPNMQTPIPYLFGSQAKSLLLGVSPKRAKSLLLGGYAFLASFLFSPNFFDYFFVFFLRKTC